MGDTPGTVDVAIERWLATRSYSASDHPLDACLGAKAGRSISAILPAREVSSTIGPIVESLVPLKGAGLLDEVVVIDAGSGDRTSYIAREAGADVYQRDEILVEHGPSLGKGDALWRGLAVTSGDIAVFLDTDTRNFDASFALGLVGPLLEDATVHLVKAAFERPLSLGPIQDDEEGGRVTELVARPLLNLFFPELAGFRQPLAGELAARRELLESMAFPAGYGVEIGILIDAWRAVGLSGMAQTDFGRREDRSKPLRDLVPMAFSVMIHALRRAGLDTSPETVNLLIPGHDELARHKVPAVERPPLASLR